MQSTSVWVRSNKISRAVIGIGFLLKDQTSKDKQTQWQTLQSNTDLDTSLRQKQVVFFSINSRIQTVYYQQLGGLTGYNAHNFCLFPSFQTKIVVLLQYKVSVKRIKFQSALCMHCRIDLPVLFGIQQLPILGQDCICYRSFRVHWTVFS